MATPRSDELRALAQPGSVSRHTAEATSDIEMLIIFALNRVWEPTHERPAERVAALEVRPDRLAERIEHALTEPNATAAARAMAGLQLETVSLAPPGPNVDRARTWLARVVEVLR